MPREYRESAPNQWRFHFSTPCPSSTMYGTPKAFSAIASAVKDFSASLQSIPVLSLSSSVA